jgi:hypothetical protein
MLRLVSALLLTAAVALAAPAFATAAPEGASEPSADAPAPKKEKLVCVRERELGSNLSTKICHTEPQWQAQRESSQESRKKPND